MFNTCFILLLLLILSVSYYNKRVTWYINILYVLVMLTHKKRGE